MRKGLWKTTSVRYSECVLTCGLQASVFVRQSNCIVFICKRLILLSSVQVKPREIYLKKYCNPKKSQGLELSHIKLYGRQILEVHRPAYTYTHSQRRRKTTAHATVFLCVLCVCVCRAWNSSMMQVCPMVTCTRPTSLWTTASVALRTWRTACWEFLQPCDRPSPSLRRLMYVNADRTC